MPTLTVALGTLAVATLVVLPAGILQRPTETPGWKSIVSVVVLGLVGTAFAYLLYYELVSGAGASRAILITYLVPPAALIYGVSLRPRLARRSVGHARPARMPFGRPARRSRHSPHQ